MILELFLTYTLCPLVANLSISSVTSPLSLSKRAKDHLVCDSLFVPSPVKPKGIYRQGDADGCAVRDSTLDSQSAPHLVRRYQGGFRVVGRPVQGDPVRLVVEIVSAKTVTFHVTGIPSASGIPAGLPPPTGGRWDSSGHHAPTPRRVVRRPGGR